MGFALERLRWRPSTRAPGQRRRDARGADCGADRRLAAHQVAVDAGCAADAHRPAGEHGLVQRANTKTLVIAGALLLDAYEWHVHEVHDGSPADVQPELDRRIDATVDAGGRRCTGVRTPSKAPRWVRSRCSAPATEALWRLAAVAANRLRLRVRSRRRAASTAGSSTRRAGCGPPTPSRSNCR